MSVDQEAVKRAYREFLDLMPLTLAIAGLRDADGAKSFSPEQMEARAMAVHNAFKVARQTVREAVRNG